MAAAAAFTPLASISGTLSNVGVLPEDPANVEDRRTEFIDFTSTVESDGSRYLYRYTVTNFTDLEIPFEWSESGLSGTLEPMGTVEREFTSDLVPTVLSSLASFTLSTTPPYLTQDFANQLEILAPVPEPHRWAQLLVGVALVVLFAGARTRGLRDRMRAA